MKKLKKIAVMLLATIMVVSLAGCRHATGGSGGSDGGDGGDGGSTTSSSATETTGIKIDGVEYAKTTVKTVIPKGTTATINMADDSSWSTYYSESYTKFKGVFLKNRNVKLSPFAMSQYEVTQELFDAVMGTNPSYFTTDVTDGETQKLRPVEQVSWYDAIAFCNKLSLKLGLTPCYSVKVSGIEVDWANLVYSSIPDESSNADWDAATVDITKNGYRLPTEAEWEFAARGGNPSGATWGYAYAGSQTAKSPANFTSSPYNDDALESYAWCGYNSSETHQVGTKTANSLGLYDMSGNVWEWCWDCYKEDCTSNDSAYTVDSKVTNPLGPTFTSGSYRVFRGGSCWSLAYYCAVSYRSNYYAYDRNGSVGFRLVSLVL